MSGSSGDWGACCARTLRLRSVCMRSKWPQRRDWFRPLRPARATHGFRRLEVPGKLHAGGSGHMSAFVTDRQTDRHRGNSSVSFVTDRLLSCSAVALNKLKFTMKDEAVLITSAPIRAPHAPSTHLPPSFASSGVWRALGTSPGDHDDGCGRAARGAPVHGGPCFQRGEAAWR